MKRDRFLLLGVNYIVFTFITIVIAHATSPARIAAGLFAGVVVLGYFLVDYWRFK